MSDITYSDIVNDIEKISKEAKISPSQITFQQYRKFGGRFTDHTIRNKAGVFSSLVKDAFPETEKDVESIAGTKRRKQYVDSLEKQIGDRNYVIERLTYNFAKSLKESPIVLKPTKIVSKSKYNPKRINVAHLSDNHFGISVDEREVEANKYGWVTAARRLGKYAQEVAYYKHDHRNECGELVINLGGDQIAGIIHTDDHNLDLLSMQIIGATRYYIQFVDYQLQAYDKVRVVATPGNHSRIEMVQKQGRALSQKYDSYLTVILEAIRQAFRNDPRVEIHQPLTPYTAYKVFDHNFLLFHGDTHPKTGSVWRSINIQDISATLDRLNVTRTESERIHVALAGHVHFGCYAWLDNGIHLFINPSLIGTDPFAQSNGSYNAPVGQWFFEATPDYAVGDMRLSNVRSADDDSSFEKIIKPFNYELNF